VCERGGVATERGRGGGGEGERDRDSRIPLHACAAASGVVLMLKCAIPTAAHTGGNTNERSQLLAAALALKF
jgi:hypothetical protein